MTEHIDLVAIRRAGPAAASAIRSAWDDDHAVFVVDPRLPAAARDRLTAQVRPTRLLDEAGRPAPVDGGEPVAPTVAAVVATSGTTAAPRAVALGRAGMEAMARSYSEAIGITPDDRWLACVPLSGVAGLAIVARSHVTGVPAVVHDGFDVEAVARAPQREGATVVSLVPTMLRRLVEAEVRLDGYRTILVGGAPLDPGLRARAEALGAAIVTTYGMTETWGGFALDGRPIAGAEVRIGEQDEIQVRGPMVMAGYHRDPAATEAAFAAGGWLRTGDAGIWDGDRLQVTGRLRDIIVTGGVNVAPAAVEAAIASHPAVSDVAVTGAPDSEWGEVVVARVVAADPRRPPTLDELRSYVTDRLGAAAAPRRLQLVDAIPRNPAGKVERGPLG